MPSSDAPQFIRGCAPVYPRMRPNLIFLGSAPLRQFEVLGLKVKLLLRMKELPDLKSENRILHTILPKSARSASDLSSGSIL